ncbi:MAG: cell division topological specificity factor MinE [bacterium]|nr:cell division topological specificity factor MinE [bacterium]
MGVLNFFRSNNSGNVAKDRLKLLLVSDRATCSPELMERMKSDIMEVISRYIDFDASALDIEIKQTDIEDNGTVVPALYANIPIRNLKVK